MLSPSQGYQLELQTKEILEVSPIVVSFSSILSYLLRFLPPSFFSLFSPLRLPPPPPVPLFLSLPPLSSSSSYSFPLLLLPFFPSLPPPPSSSAYPPLILLFFKTNTGSYLSPASSITRERVPPASCLSTRSTVSTSLRHHGGCYKMSYAIYRRWTLMGKDMHLNCSPSLALAMLLGIASNKCLGQKSLSSTR